MRSFLPPSGEGARPLFLSFACTVHTPVLLDTLFVRNKSDFFQSYASAKLCSREDQVTMAFSSDEAILIKYSSENHNQEKG